jgi:hypothetical protein
LIGLRAIVVFQATLHNDMSSCDSETAAWHPHFQRNREVAHGKERREVGRTIRQILPYGIRVSEKP